MSDLPEKIVTYADLPVLREVLASVASEDGEGSAEYELVDRLIAAAKADAPPKPVLEDGLYLGEPDEDGDREYVTVRDGRWSTYVRDDGTIWGGGRPLPDDASGWTRVHVLADDEVAVERWVVEQAAEGLGVGWVVIVANLRAALEARS